MRWTTCRDVQIDEPPAAAAIRFLRENGLDDAEMTARLGVSSATLANWFFGNTTPRGRLLGRLIGVLETLPGAQDLVGALRAETIDGRRPRNVERDRTIIRMYREGFSGGEIAAQFGISRQRVCQLLAHTAPAAVARDVAH